MSISFRAVSESGMPISKPAGTVDGDVMVAVIGSSNGTTTDAISTPSGWTKVGQVAGGATRCAVYIKVASGEGANYTWTTPTGTVDGIISSFSGVDNTTPQDATAGSATITANTDFTTPAIVTVTDNAWVVSGAHATLGMGIGPSNMNRRDAALTNNGSADASKTPTGTFTPSNWHNGISGDWSGWTIALRPFVNNWPNVTMDEVLPVIVTQTPGASDWTGFPDYLASRFLWTYRAWQPPPPPAFTYRELQPLGRAALISLNAAPPVAVILEPIWPQPVPPPAVAGVQPIPDNWLPFLSFLEQFPIVRGPQPVPPAAVAGIQPYVRLPWVPVEHQIDFAYRGPGPQPVPGPAIAGAQPGNETWLAFLGISNMRFTGQGPQPVPPIAVAGAQPPVRIAWFDEAVAREFVFANWPQPDGS